MRHRLQTGDLVMFHAAIRQFPCDWEDTPLIFIKTEIAFDNMRMCEFMDRAGCMYMIIGGLHELEVLSRVAEALG